MMLSNQSIHWNKEPSDFLTYFRFEVQALNDATARKSPRLYKAIENAVHNFDRYFDNTVVDTYAFDKAIQSEEVKKTIYYHLNDSEHSMIIRLASCKEAISSYIIHEVNELYQHNHHTIYNLDVYDDYLDRLFDRILIN